ncbi:MAG TPA: carboxypeptidase M32 [Opitutales bacterium]|nr:carboxypeptidase M32 [Opitutales bacterium]
METMKDHNSDFEKLTGRLRRLHDLRSVAGILGWDEQVNLPSGSGALRSEQLALMSGIAHREASSPALGRLIEKLEARAASLSPDENRVVEIARRDFDEAVKLPGKFVRTKAENDSRAFQAWQSAKNGGKFADFEPLLRLQIETAAKQAELLGRGGDAYSYWIDHFDPGSDLALVESLLTPLEKELAPLSAQIASAHAEVPEIELKGFPKDAQREFVTEILTAMGFDFTRGRMDTALHPFCDGDGRDTRITTRYDEDNPLDSVFSAIHECGHALYEQGLPTQWAGTAIGDSAGMAVHESQSRIWENQVGRSRAFWQFWEPRFRAKFPAQTAGISSEALFMAINRVKAGPVRLDADEVTYNLHIILRFDMERDLFSGKLAPRDIPEAWAALSQRLLGCVPTSDREGCMQDVHWAAGLFGYFPSYTMGNLLASSLWSKARAELSQLDTAMASGDMAPLLDWLRKNVHAYARRLSANQISERICGAKLSHCTLISYIHDRYQTPHHL